MSAQAEVLLCRWGRWALRLRSNGLGYASGSSLMRYSGDRDSYGDSPPLGVADVEMAEVDAVVNGLPMVLRVVVVAVYRDGQGKSERVLAAQLGVSRQWLTQCLETVRGRVEDAL